LRFAIVGQLPVAVGSIVGFVPPPPLVGREASAPPSSSAVCPLDEPLAPPEEPTSPLEFPWSSPEGEPPFDCVSFPPPEALPAPLEPDDAPVAEPAAPWPSSPPPFVDEAAHEALAASVATARNANGAAGDT
jgi:hypothetical protein